MDRAEAIEWLEQIKDIYIRGGDEDFDRRRKEALDLAIEALVLHDKHNKAMERMIEGAKEIKIFLERMTCDYNAIDAESETTTDEVVDFNNMISGGGRIRNLPPVTPTEKDRR